MSKTVRNIIIRGVAAAVAGVAVEMLNAFVKPGTRKTSVAQDRIPEAEEWLQSVTHRAAEWAQDADVSERVRDLCHRILSSGVVDKTGAAASKIIDLTKDKAQGTRHRSA
jgi:hypothetical protein